MSHKNQLAIMKAKALASIKHNPLADMRVEFTHDLDALKMEWMVCGLTKALMRNGESVQMKECIQRLAIWSKDQKTFHQTGYEMGTSVVEVTMKVKIQYGTNSRESVLVESAVMPKGYETENSPWIITDTCITVRDIPTSLAEDFLTDFNLTKIVDEPFLRGRTAEKVKWNGQMINKEGHRDDSFSIEDESLVIYISSDEKWTRIKQPET